jgi:hypothetical protein
VIAVLSQSFSLSLYISISSTFSINFGSVFSIVIFTFDHFIFGVISKLISKLLAWNEDISFTFVVTKAISFIFSRFISKNPIFDFTQKSFAILGWISQIIQTFCHLTIKSAVLPQ